MFFSINNRFFFPTNEKNIKNKSMKTHAKLSYMSRCYAALKVNQHFNHETKNDFFQELESFYFQENNILPITLH